MEPTKSHLNQPHVSFKPTVMKNPPPCPTVTGVLWFPPAVPGILGKRGGCPSRCANEAPLSTIEAKWRFCRGPTLVAQGEWSCLESVFRAPKALPTQRFSTIIADTIPDGFGTSAGSILGPEMASKMKLQGAPEALPDGYCSKMEKDKVLASFILPYQQGRDAI